MGGKRGLGDDMNQHLPVALIGDRDSYQRQNDSLTG